MISKQPALMKLVSIVSAFALSTCLTPASAFAETTPETGNATSEQMATETAEPEEATANTDDASPTVTEDPTNTRAPDEAASASEAASSADESASADPSDPMAAIGDTTYSTLSDAVKAAKPGDTITMRTDADLSGAGTLDISGVTLDLAGHTIKAKNFTLIFMGSNATIKNGTFDALGGSYGLFFGDNPPSDQVLIEDINVIGGINIYDATNVVLRNVNADASATDSLYYAVWADVNADVTIESGTYTSNGAAIVGLTNSQENVPPSTMSIKGGSFYTEKSPLALPGEGRYLPTISGGSFPDHEETAKYLTGSVTVLPESDGRFTVKPFATTPTAASSTAVPAGSELIVVDPSADEEQEISDALANSDVQSAFAKVGGTGTLWTEDVILRDTQTLEEQHDTEMTFTLPYPDAFDSAHYADYDFVVLHLKATDDANAPTPEILDAARVTPTADGLQLTSTLSPFAIASKAKADASNTSSQNTNTGTLQTASQDNNSAAAATTSTASNGMISASAASVMHSAKEPTAEQAADPLTKDAITLVEPTPITIEPRSHVGSDAETGGQQNTAAGLQPGMLWLTILLGIVAILCGGAGIILVRKGHHQRKHVADAKDAPDA